MLLTRYPTIQYCKGLSNEVLCILALEGAVNLLEVKVEGLKILLAWLPRFAKFYHVNLGSRVSGQAGFFPNFKL